jgi:hypothetical protein
MASRLHRSGDVGNSRINASDKLLFWDHTGTRSCRAWPNVEMSADSRSPAIRLRKGEVVGRRALRPTISCSGSRPVRQWGYRLTDPDMSVNGKPGKVVRSTDHDQVRVRGPVFPFMT